MSREDAIAALKRTSGNVDRALKAELAASGSTPGCWRSWPGSTRCQGEIRHQRNQPLTLTSPLCARQLLPAHPGLGPKRNPDPDLVRTEAATCEASVAKEFEADPRRCRDLVRAPADSPMAEADHGLPPRAAEAAAALAAERTSARAPSPLRGAARCVACCLGLCRVAAHHWSIGWLTGGTSCGLLAGSPSTAPCSTNWHIVMPCVLRRDSRQGGWGWRQHAHLQLRELAAALPQPAAPQAGPLAHPPGPRCRQRRGASGPVCNE